MSITTTIALCLSLGTADPEIGGKVVTLTTAPVMCGAEKLAEVEPGVELTVTDLKLPWIGVTVTQNGKDAKGWVLDRNVVMNPDSAFAALLGYYGKSRPDLQSEFQRIDANANGSMTIDEFLDATTLDSLDDLNLQLQRRLNDFRRTFTAPDPRLRSQAILMALAGEVGRLKGLKKEISFNGWKRVPTNEEAKRMAEDFLRTGDVRRSKLAHQLVETPGERTRKSHAMFAWADRDADSGLSVEEFVQAASVQPATPATTGKPSVSRSSPKPSAVASGAGASEMAEQEPDIECLIRSLENPDSDVRRRAAQTLRSVGQEAKAAVPALIVALNDESRIVREFAAAALGNIGPEAKAAVPALIDAFSDESYSPRTSAAAALGSIGPDAEAAVPALTQALTDDSSMLVRKYAAQALGSIGPDAKAAVPILTQALTDDSSLVRKSAATALGNIGPDAKAAMPALTKLLNDRLLKRTVQHALKKISAEP